MQAKSILMVLSAMALVTACANDETIEINYGESISLSAVAGKTTRTGISRPDNVTEMKNLKRV